MSGAIERVAKRYVERQIIIGGIGIVCWMFGLPNIADAKEVLEEVGQYIESL